MKTIFHNATFHTMESEDDIRTSLTVEDGVIAGFDETPTACPSAQAVDLGGLHVFPTLIDAHLHLLDTIALSSMGEAVCEIVHGRVEPHDLAGAERKIRALATDAKPGSLLICSNFIAAAMDEGRLPTRFELDAWARGAQVWVINIDGHSGSCSSSLLEALGLEDIAPDGVFSGPAHDANLGAFTDHLASSITPKALARGIAHVCNECAAFGIGTVCALEGTDDSERDRMAELTALIAQRLPLDVRLFPQYMDEKKLEAVRGRMGAARVGGCMKWELDGSVGSRTAAFASPYLDGTHGSALLRRCRAYAAPSRGSPRAGSWCRPTPSARRPSISWWTSTTACRDAIASTTANSRAITPSNASAPRSRSSRCSRATRGSISASCTATSAT